MIPLDLTLRNFMSYGEEPTTVDFRGMHVVCLSGDNGHGKSALLDAITWALWGETRMGRQGHEQLIRLGCDEMSVVLTFMEGENVCRVRRQRSRRSGGQVWEAQIQEASGAWRPITGQSSGDTGRAIVRFLRMNYETFLNSAYLRQGRADEFVRQTANKRKEILAEILDLSRYDDLEARARRHMHDSKTRATDAQRDLAQIDAELAQQPSYEQGLTGVEMDLAEIAERQSEISGRLDKLSDLRATLTAQRSSLNAAEQQVKEIEQQIERQQQTMESERAIIEDAQKLLGDRERIELAHKRHEEAVAATSSLEDAARQFRSLDRRRIEIENEINGERRVLESNLRNLQRRQGELATSIRVLPRLQEQLVELEAAQTQYAALTQRREALWEDLQKLEPELATLRASYDQTDIALKAQEERLDEIARQEATCSVCGSPLPPEKIERLAEECAAQIDVLKRRASSLRQHGIARRAQKKRIDADLATVQEEMTRREAERGELGALQQRQRDLLEIQQQELPKIEADAAAMSDDIQNERFGMGSRAEMARLMPDLEKSRDAEALLEANAREIQRLRSIQTVFARLENAARDLAAAQERMETATKMIDGMREQRASYSASIEQAPALDRQIEANRQEIEKIRYEKRQSEERMQRAHREQGRLQQIIHRGELMRDARAERETLLLSAKNDEDIYATLADCFSKRGVQALIIENVLPELEQDANGLLQRLTDGQLSLAIQTTRQAKSRAATDAPIETLDISISDQLGSRALEMYSGGESFRISFALRIALSKLLARRAGASLQTLIIDEGFGTQDAKGREKLVDAIMAIQDEFAQIIVITHVDELKDAFPNRIEIVKTPMGSEPTVIFGAALG